MTILVAERKILSKKWLHNLGFNLKQLYDVVKSTEKSVEKTGDELFNTDEIFDLLRTFQYKIGKIETGLKRNLDSLDTETTQCSTSIRGGR